MFVSLSPKAQAFMIATPGLMWTMLIFSFVFLVALTCCPAVAQMYPVNYAILLMWTVCETYLLSAVASIYTTTSVVQAVALTAVVTFSLMTYAKTTTRDLSGMGPYLLAGLLILVFGSIIRIFLPHIPFMDTVWACFGALLFSFYIVYDTWMIMKRVTPDQVIFCALALYLDIINLFIYILEIFGSRRSD
jgi:FtsH-binding integral membrane protein